jgi:DNA-directed RNA polymerase subunit RPC12/RpoP
MATLITVYTAHETDFDENLGYIPSKNKTANGLQGDAAWVMRCPRCKATWEWESPTQDQGCPACRYALIEGSRKDVFQGVGGAAVYDTLITEMIEKQVDDNTASSYDRY